MPGPVQLTGLQGYVMQQPEDTPQQVHGSPANPAHADSLWNMKEMYPYESGIDGLSSTAIEIPIFTDSIGDDPHTFQAGKRGDDPTGDYTPYGTRAAPFPKALIFNRNTGPNHLPEGNSAYLEQSAEIHASKTNAGAAFLYDPTMEAQNDTWQAFYDVEVGQSNVDTNIGAQGKSGFAPGGWASRGRDQTFARQNEYGFDAAHMHRRWATGTIPGNYMWMRPGGRMMVKSMPGPARPPVGKISPFAGQDVSWGYAASSNVGGVMVNSATEYQQPPTPYVAPVNDAAAAAEGPTVELW